MADAIALSLRHVSKSFGASRALSDVAWEVSAGEVHGLLGQNGAGKSTLVKILAGYHAPDAGASIVVWGRAVTFPIGDASRLGLAIIHQDLALVDTMTVVENLGIATKFAARGFAPIDWRARREEAVAALHRMHLDVDPETPVGLLSPAERALVAIARATLRLANTPGRTFVLDEPTAHLGGVEAGRLLALMRSVAAGGAAVVFISHHIGEVLAASDRVSVLRDGQLVATLDAADTSKAELVTLMLGRRLETFYPAPLTGAPGAPLLQARGVSSAVVRGLDLDLAAGEVVGVTGLTGMGHADVPYLLAGARSLIGGQITLPDGRCLTRGVQQAKRAGVVLIPGDRQRSGVWPAATSAENISLPVLSRFFDRGWLRLRAETRAAGELMAGFGVRPPIPTRPVSTLSGGNQQKVLLAKWLQHRPKVLLLDEPSQGVDAGAKRDILEIVRSRASEGAAVLISSSDQDQLANLCTRVLVMSRGRVVSILAGDELTEENLVHACHDDA